MALRKLIRNILCELFDSKIILDFDEENIMLGDIVVGEFHMYNHRQGKYLTLSKIEVYPEYRNMGYAAQTMDQIIQYANVKNLIIVLTPEAYISGGMSTVKLTDWYKSFGFIMNKGKNKDFETMQLMYKLPSSIEETLDYTGNLTTPSIRAYPAIPAKFPDADEFDQFGNSIKNSKL